MKEKKTKRGNQPYYAQYLTSDAPKTSDKKSSRPADDKRKRTDAPASERSFDAPRPEGKPYGTKSFDKPFGERSAPKKQEDKRFNKPTGYKSSFKSKDTAPDKPFERREERPERKPFAEKRSFDKPFERREERRDDRPERKPFGEKRSFDKPFERREERSERKPFGEKRTFDKPFERREERPERKPLGEKRTFDKPFERREERPERKPFGEKRTFDKPFERREERRNDRPERKNVEQWPDVRGRAAKPVEAEAPEKQVFEKRGEGFEKLDKTRSRAERFDKPEDKKPRVSRDGGESRRVGDLKEAPRYNMERAVERLPDRQKPVIVKHEQDDLIRLNRYIANAGVCSRREADELIGMGQITVNGQLISELGFKVKRSDVVKYAGRTLNPEKTVYILINKPKDYITTTEDPEDRHTVMELIAGACAERVYPVGRLDRNTTGLLLFTNDGELAEKLMHPSNQIQKIYQVELDKPITTEHFEAIKAGIELEDGFVKADEVGIVTPDAMVVGIEIHSGRNRIVRRIFEHLGYDVLKLDRTAYAGLNKKDLPRGKWRFLDEREVVRLKYLI